MSEDYVLPEDTVAASPRRFEKTLRVLIFIAALCLSGELIWLLAIAPFRPFSAIDVSGYDGIEREVILANAGITSSSSFFSADVAVIEKALMSLSQLESVRVFKSFPGRLQITLEGRRPVATALASVNSETVPVVFDSRGVIFQVGGNEIDGLLSGRLPVISGIFIEDPFPGMKLPVFFVSLFLELEKIKISSPELLEAVSEIRINRKLFDTYDLLLYPVHKKIKIRLSELNEDILRYSLLMVDVLAAKEDGIDTLDFRSGIASYIPKEAAP